MPISYKLFPGSSLFTTHLTGVVTFEEFETAYKEILSQTQDWPEMTEISNVDTTASIQIAPRGLRDLAERLAGTLSRRGVRLRMAIIAPSDVSYGLACVYRAQAGFSGNNDVTVVRSTAEAALWVGDKAMRIAGFLPQTDKA